LLIKPFNMEPVWLTGFDTVYYVHPWVIPLHILFWILELACNLNRYDSLRKWLLRLSISYKISGSSNSQYHSLVKYTSPHPRYVLIMFIVLTVIILLIVLIWTQISCASWCHKYWCSLRRRNSSSQRRIEPFIIEHESLLSNARRILDSLNMRPVYPPLIYRSGYRLPDHRDSYQNRTFISTFSSLQQNPDYQQPFISSSPNASSNHLYSPGRGRTQSLINAPNHPTAQGPRSEQTYHTHQLSYTSTADNRWSNYHENPPSYESLSIELP